MNNPIALIGVVIVLGMALVYAVSGTVALIRTSQLSTHQKALQGIFVWFIPFLGPLLVMHLLSERDVASIPTRWSKNEEINSYVWQALTGHARMAYKSATLYVETQVIETIGEALSDSAAPPTGSAGAGDID